MPKGKHSSKRMEVPQDEVVIEETEVSGSSVPLATGNLPGEPTEAELDLMMERERRLKQAEAIPSAAQVRENVAQYIAADSAKKSRDNFHHSAEEARAEKAFKKQADEYMQDHSYEESEKLATILNRYRQAYKDRINYKFKPMYSADMGLDYLKATLGIVRNIVDMVDIPSTMAQVAVKLAELFEMATAMASERFALDIDFSNFSSDVQTAIEQGVFNAELMQASVELADMFSIPYWGRGGFKLFGIAAKRFERNRLRAAGVEAPNFDAVHVDMTDL